MAVHTNRESVNPKMNDTIPTTEELRQRREQSGINQITVAVRMKVAPSYLCDLEQGKRDWNAELVRRFDKAIKGKKCL